MFVVVKPSVNGQIPMFHGLNQLNLRHRRVTPVTPVIRGPKAVGGGNHRSGGEKVDDLDDLWA